MNAHGVDVFTVAIRCDAVKHVDSKTEELDQELLADIEEKGPLACIAKYGSVWARPEYCSGCRFCSYYDSDQMA